MNLKDIKERFMGGFGGGKKEGENDVIILQSKKNKGSNINTHICKY